MPLFLQELEEKRKEKSKFAYERKKQLAKLRLKAEKVVEEKLGSQLSKEGVCWLEVKQDQAPLLMKTYCIWLLNILLHKKFDNEDGPGMPLMLVTIDYMAKNVRRRGEDFNPLPLS
ncbi:hypothetical protein Dimus_013259 [Dionaea muscipula]